MPHSGLEAMWSNPVMGGWGVRPDGYGLKQAWRAEFGYGFGARRFWYPFVAMETMGGFSRALRYGFTLDAFERLYLSVEFGRRESERAEAAEDSVLIQIESDL